MPKVNVPFCVFLHPLPVYVYLPPLLQLQMHLRLASSYSQYAGAVLLLLLLLHNVEVCLQCVLGRIFISSLMYSFLSCALYFLFLCLVHVHMLAHFFSPHHRSSSPSPPSLSSLVFTLHSLHFLPPPSVCALLRAAMLRTPHGAAACS